MMTTARPLEKQQFAATKWLVNAQSLIDFEDDRCLSKLASANTGSLSAGLGSAYSRHISNPVAH